METLKVPGGGQAYPDAPPSYEFSNSPKQGFGYVDPPGYGMPPNQQPAGDNPPPVGVFMTRQPMMVEPPLVRKSEHFVESILTCLCCFWPIGIAALVMSCKSTVAYDSGDIAEGQRYGRMAGILALTSFICGVVLLIIYLSLRYTVYAVTY